MKLFYLAATLVIVTAIPPQANLFIQQAQAAGYDDRNDRRDDGRDNRDNRRRG